MFIYLIQNTVNGKVYVGKTTDTIASRWNSHVTASKTDLQHLICRAIRKYGPAAFTVEELCQASSLEELNALECHYIALFKSSDPKVGYNMTLGGDGCVVTDEVRQKMRAAWTPERRAKQGKISASRVGALNPNFGKRGVSPKQLEALRKRGLTESNKLKMTLGYRRWLETGGRLELSKRKAGIKVVRKVEANTFKDKATWRANIKESWNRRRLVPVSDETRQKMSRTRKGRPGRPIADAQQAKMQAGVRRWREAQRAAQLIA